MKRSLNRLMGIKMMIPVMKLIMNSSDKQKCSIFCYRKVTRLTIQLRRPTATLPCLVACLCNHSLREHEVTCFTNTRWCALVTGSLEGLLSLFCGPQIPEMHGISSYTIKFVLSESLCVCVWFLLPCQRWAPGDVHTWRTCRCLSLSPSHRGLHRRWRHSVRLRKKMGEIKHKGKV